MIVFNKPTESEIKKLVIKKIWSGYWWAKKKLDTKWWMALVIIGVVGGLVIFSRKNIPTRIKLKIGIVKESLVTGYYRVSVKPKESLVLDIGFKEIKKIEKKREEAINQTVLLTSRADLVPASIRYQDEILPVKVRLKGDWLDHLKSSKWSLRVETKEESPFKGMRRFSLQVPEARNYINEWLFLKTIQDEGLISLNYDFLKVSINGESQGIYALEEHVSKEVIERSQRREGPVLKLNADRFWQTVSQFGGKERFASRESLVNGYAFGSLVEGFQQSQLEKDPALAELLVTSVNKLQAYREGRLSPDQVFDYEAWSKYLVLADLFGADHGFFWENYRFYYNPVTGLFEPIPFDNEPGKMIENLAVHTLEPDLLSKVFMDESFLAEYIKQSKKYADQNFIGTKISQYAEEIDYYTKLLRQDYPNYAFNPTNFFENADFIRQSMLIDQGVRVAVDQKLESINQLKVENLLQLPVEILSVIDKEGSELLNNTYVLTGTKKYQLPEMDVINLNKSIVVDDKSLDKLKISYQLLGSEESKTVGVIKSKLTDVNFKASYPPESVGFISYSHTTNSYVIAPGNYQLDKLVVIPSGTKLQVLAGTKIEVTTGGGIVSHSPVFFKGTELSPVVINGYGQGQGLLVLKTNDESEISHTKFIGLKPIETTDNKTLGAINFYEADVSISETEFIENYSEDQLNIVRSEFLLTKSTIIKAMSDGVDFDFSNGKIVDCSFIESTNDGVDFSGSQVEIEGLLIDGAGDKGISAGERSQILVNRTSIKNARIGVASKDLSEVTLGGEIVFDNLEVGLAAYQKKPEYGPAIINQDLVQATNIQTNFLIEEGSILQQPWDTVVKGTEKNLGERFQ